MLVHNPAPRLRHEQGATVWQAAPPGAGQPPSVGTPLGYNLHTRIPQGAPRPERQPAAFALVGGVTVSYPGPPQRVYRALVDWSSGWRGCWLLVFHSFRTLARPRTQRRCMHGGAWAHCSRKFVDLLQLYPRGPGSQAVVQIDRPCGRSCELICCKSSTRRHQELISSHNFACTTVVCGPRGTVAQLYSCTAVQGSTVPLLPQRASVQIYALRWQLQ
jgi:hypothetical protein